MILNQEGYIKEIYMFGKNVEILFNIHKGFDSLVDLRGFLSSINIDYDKSIVIRFLEQYYAIVFEDYDREIIIGKDDCYYTNEKYQLIKCKTKNFQPKFLPTFIKKQVYNNLQLYYDLEEIDTNFDILKNGKSIKGSDYAKTYAIILGVSFISHYFTYDELFILKAYFDEDYSYIFNTMSGVEGINPFKGKIKYLNGNIRNFQFFKKSKNYSHSWIRRFHSF